MVSVADSIFGTILQEGTMMSSPQQQTTFTNLNSRFSGWLDGVQRLMEELEPRLDRFQPTITTAMLAGRIAGISYVGLVDDRILQSTRRAFPEADRDRERSKIPGWLDNRLRRGLDERSTHSNCLRDNDGNEGIPSVHRAAPHHGARKPGKEPVAVITDPYGIYTPSFRGWLDGLSGKCPETFVSEWRERLDPSSCSAYADGPAVILCPENIATLYPLLARLGDQKVRDCLKLDAGIDREFVKFVLWHEIGHHVFPVSRCPQHDRKDLREAMANWFVFRLLSEHERVLFDAKADMQSDEYRMYRGLRVLGNPAGAGLLGRFALSWFYPCALTPAAWFELLAFSGDLDSSSKGIDEWLSDMDRFIEFLQDGARDPWLNEMANRHRSSSSRVYEPDLWAWALIEEAFGLKDQRFEGVVSRVLKQLS